MVSRWILGGFFRGLFAAAAIAQAGSALASTGNDLEALGTNEKVAERVARIENRSRIGIVQNRLVPRRWRVEFGASYGPVATGDAYLNSQYLSGEASLHINPSFSLGVRYSSVFNSLTDAGRERYDRARTTIATNSANDASVPSIDYAESMVMGLINWYMTHGKINLFDLQVVQFDLYSLAGYGQVTLASGETPVWTAGGGLAFWLNNHITTRFELRYENYSDRPAAGLTRNLNLIVGTFGLGILI